MSVDENRFELILCLMTILMSDQGWLCLLVLILKKKKIPSKGKNSLPYFKGYMIASFNEPGERLSLCDSSNSEMN